MKVTQFFMGMGPRIWSTHRNGVEYGVRALPIGAYVRIIGMNNMDECDPADEPVAYRSKSYPRKLLVISAGSLMHMVIAFVLFFGVFATAGRYDETGRVRVIYDAAENSPAERAGIQQDDVIVSVAGQKVSTRYEFIVQIVDRAAPSIIENDFRDIALTSIVYTDSASGEALRNTCQESGLSAGISVSAPADPTLTGNECSITRSS